MSDKQQPTPALFPEFDADRLAELNAKIADANDQIALDESLIEQVTFEPKRRIKEARICLTVWLAERRHLRSPAKPEEPMPLPDHGQRVAIVGGGMNGDKLAKQQATAREHAKRAANDDAD